MCFHSSKLPAPLRPSSQLQEGGISSVCNCLFVCTHVDSFLCSGCCAGTGGLSLCSQTILSPAFGFQDSGNQVPVLVVTKSHFILDYSFSKS